MEKLNKTLKNDEKAITLIALVITIIVLIILAGISISLVLGNNGIITKAKDAKTNTERKSVIELAQTDILGQIAENNGNYISKEQLATILNKQFKTIDANSIPNEISITDDIELTTKDEKYKINLSEVYIGKLTQVDASVTASEINSQIGKIINYTSPTNSGYTGEWKILYATDEEVFIITNEVIDKNTTLSESKVLLDESIYYYEGSKDIRDNYINHRNSNGLGYDYGSRYNSRWLAVCEASGNESTYGNAKYTAYMCDPDNWTKYVTGKASYAVGGVTMELLELSVYETTKNPNVIGELILTPEYMIWNKIIGYGYDHDLNNLNHPYSSEYQYIFASPAYEDDSKWRMFGYSYDRTNDLPVGEYDVGIRPVVSIPISEIKINGEQILIK